MKYPANLSHTGTKVTLISVGAVVSVAAPAQATITHVTTPVILNSSGDQWCLNGGSSGTLLTQAYVYNAASTNTFYLEPQASTANLNLAHTTSGIRSFVINYTASSSNVIYNGMTPVMSMGASDTTYVFINGNKSDLSSYDFKNFTSNVTGYVAFSFVLGSTTTYGWAQILYNVDTNVLTISQWAYSSNESIYVGQTTSSIPEPAETAGGLGLLALGAAGMSRYLRNRKKTVA